MSLVQVNQILNGVNMIHIEDEIFLKKKFDFEKLKEDYDEFRNYLLKYQCERKHTWHQNSTQ